VIYSYTFFNDWENCNHKAARKHILKDLPRGPQTEQMKWGITVHKAFEDRINSGKPFDPELAKYEKYVNFGHYRVRAELKVAVDAKGAPCDFFDNDKVKVRGKIDIQLDRADRPDTAVIIDVKTGKVREDPGEIELHAMMLGMRYPQMKNIYGHYLWLRDDRLGKRHDLSGVAQKWNETQALIDDVEHAIKMQHFPKNQNPLCDWCDVKDCEFNGKGRNR